MGLQKITELCFLLTIFALPSYLIKFSIFSMPTNLLEILALLSIFLLVLDKKTSVFISWKNTLKPVLIPAVLLFSGLLFSFSANKWSLGGLGIIKGWFMIPFLFSLSLPSVFKNDRMIKLAIRSLFFSVFLVALLSLFYKLSGILTYDQRLSAFYPSPNQLAMFLAPGFFLSFYVISEEEKNTLKYLGYFSLLATIPAFYSTLSYAAWLAVAFSFGIVSLSRNLFFKKITFLLFAATILVFSVFLFFQHDSPKLNNLLDSRSSLSSRLMIWKSSLKIAEDNPIFGIGPGNFQISYLEYQKYFPPYLEWAVPQPHNLYLAFYLQTGLLGLIGFLLFCYKWLFSGFKQKNTGFLAVSLGILFYVLIHGLVDTPYWKNDLAYSFWIFFFLTIASSNDPKGLQKSNL